MARRIRPLVIPVLTLVLLLSTTGVVSAQEYNEDAEGIFDMLDRVTSFLLDALLRVGMIILLAGALIWLTSKKSANRSETGRWLVGGGIVMMIVSLSFNAITALIEWIAIGS